MGVLSRGASKVRAVHADGARQRPGHGGKRGEAIGGDGPMVAWIAIGFVHCVGIREDDEGEEATAQVGELLPVRDGAFAKVVSEGVDAPEIDRHVPDAPLRGA